MSDQESRNLSDPPGDKQLTVSSNGNSRLSLNERGGYSVNSIGHSAVVPASNEAYEIAKAVHRLFPESPCSTRLIAAAAVFEKLPDHTDCKQQLQDALLPVIELVIARLQEMERQHLPQVSKRSDRNGNLDNLRSMNDPLRRLWDDSFSRVEQELQDRVRSRLLPLSLIANRIQNLVEDLSESSLQSEHLGRNIRLQITPDARRNAEAVLLRSLDDTVVDDVSWLNGEQVEIVRRSRSILPTTSIENACFVLEEFSASKLLDWLKPQLSLSVKYSGELPHRTFFDRLSHGRRPVFAVMMIISLVGAGLGFGRGTPAAVAPLALLLFVGGIMWTFRSFGEERQWLLERELGRLRETMANECQRSIEGLLKEWLSRATRLLRDRQKSLQRQFEDWSKGHTTGVKAAEGTGSQLLTEPGSNARQELIEELSQLKSRTEQLINMLNRDVH